MKSVYLVEDSALLRAEIVRAIEEGGTLCVVGSAGRAEVAIREIRELRPDCAVVDLQLAQGTGWDVIEEVGLLPQRVMILTNHGSESFRTEAESRGVLEFFDKSTEFELFLQGLSAT